MSKTELTIKGQKHIQHFLSYLERSLSPSMRLTKQKRASMRRLPSATQSILDELIRTFQIIPVLQMHYRYSSASIAWSLFLGSFLNDMTWHSNSKTPVKRERSSVQLDDDCINQAVTQKLVMDTLLPISNFEKSLITMKQYSSESVWLTRLPMQLKAKSFDKARTMPRTA